jgi:hypothetical protein
MSPEQVANKALNNADFHRSLVSYLVRLFENDRGEDQWFDLMMEATDLTGYDYDNPPPGIDDYDDWQEDVFRAVHDRVVEALEDL